MKLADLDEAIISSAAFAGIGIVVFAIAFWLMTKIAPFSVRKEIEEDQNVALAILIGSALIGLAVIIGQAVG
jgi:uncharacterized membrane protein YjfL (UPF0719 family)